MSEGNRSLPLLRVLAQQVDALAGTRVTTQFQNGVEVRSALLMDVGTQPDAVASVTPIPPTTSRVPSNSNVALWAARPTPRFALCRHVPLAVSYTSVLLTT